MRRFQSTATLLLLIFSLSLERAESSDLRGSCRSILSGISAPSLTELVEISGKSTEEVERDLNEKKDFSHLATVGFAAIPAFPGYIGIILLRHYLHWHGVVPDHWSNFTQTLVGALVLLQIRKSLREHREIVPKRYLSPFVVAAIISVNLYIESVDAAQAKRSFDWPDVAAGTIGGALAFPVSWASDVLARHLLKREYLRLARLKTSFHVEN